jgi:hypothetical protein
MVVCSLFPRINFRNQWRTKMEKYNFHLFCDDGRVVFEKRCPHTDAPGEEFAALTLERARQIALRPECCRWAMAQDSGEFACPNGHNLD